MRLARLAMCDEKFVHTVFSVMKAQAIKPEQIFAKDGVDFRVHYDGEVFQVTIKPSGQGENIDCLFMVSPVQRGEIVFGCFVGFGWMLGSEILQRLEYVK